MVLFHKDCFILVIFSLIFYEESIATGIGKCPKLDYMQNFNLTKFTGRWYEIERSFYLMQVISTCVSVDLKQNQRGNLIVDVQTTSTWSGSLAVKGVASRTKKDPSLLVYRVVSDLPRAVSRYLPGAGFYQVLDTDYKNFAVLYSCTNYGLLHTDLVWIWGRNREIDANLRLQIYEMLGRLRLDTERLILPKNTNCTD